MIIIKSGDSNTSPIYQDSKRTPIWSGKKSDEFDSKMIIELKSFILIEAKRMGFSDAASNTIRHTYLFDDAFLDGWPSVMWSENYLSGIYLHNQLKENLIPIL